MSTQAIEAIDRSFLTTDDMQIGFAAARPTAPTFAFERIAGPAEGQQEAIWAMLLQGELEEAVDAVLLRATFASTPTLTGPDNHMLSGSGRRLAG